MNYKLSNPQGSDNDEVTRIIWHLELRLIDKRPLGRLMDQKNLTRDHQGSEWVLPHGLELTVVNITSKKIVDPKSNKEMEIHYILLTNLLVHRDGRMSQELKDHFNKIQENRAYVE